MMKVSDISECEEFDLNSKASDTRKASAQVASLAGDCLDKGIGVPESRASGNGRSLC